jgi:hypothetical protein
MKQDKSTTPESKAILELYEEYEKRKELKKVSLNILFEKHSVKKWYQFWKII